MDQTTSDRRKAPASRRKIPLTAYFEPEDYEKIQALAESRQQSMSDFVVGIVRQSIRDVDPPPTVDERLAAMDGRLADLEARIEKVERRLGI